MLDRDEFVEQLLSKLPLGDYCLFIVRENNKFSSLTLAEIDKILQDFKSSKKHANFIINSGNATSHDIKELIGEMKKLAHDNYGVDFEEEVEFI